MVGRTPCFARMLEGESSGEAEGALPKKLPPQRWELEGRQDYNQEGGPAEAAGEPARGRAGL